MKETANIAASVRALWLADPVLPGLVPGGLLYGVRPAPALRPFASMAIGLAGDAEYQTGNAYCQDYNLTIRVWSGETLAQAGEIQEALEALLSPATKLQALSAAASTLAIWLQPPASAGNQLVLAEVEEMQERLFGKFVFTAAASWLIQLQESRV
jgi:hypothetical protein